RRPMAGCRFNCIQNGHQCARLSAGGGGGATGNQDWHSDVGLIDQRIVPRPKLQSLTLLPRTMTETTCDQIGTWKLIRRRPTLALTKSECLGKSSPYRRPYISRPASLLS